RLLPLGDGVVLHPAHGAGSICGARIGARAESTLGIERTQSPVLRFHDKAGFVRYKLEEHQERPPYFRMMERYNLEGPPPVGGVRVPPALAPAEFRREMEAGATVVDMRQPSAFGGSHLKGSYSVWLDGLSTFAGWVLSYESPVLLVAGSGSEVEPACRQLSRLGYDRVVGYLKRGVEEWYSAGLPVEHLILMSVQELRHSLERGEELTVLDVRGLDEWQRGHIEGARNIYVGHLEERLGEVPRDKAVVVMCSSGWRGGLGASILLRAGYPNVMNVLGGFGAWKALGFPATGS
ncbi:MAG: rhodanese-like domain-containing protein, partial [Chloroflexota bacterium]